MDFKSPRQLCNSFSEPKIILISSQHGNTVSAFPPSAVSHAATHIFSPWVSLCAGPPIACRLPPACLPSVVHVCSYALTRLFSHAGSLTQKSQLCHAIVLFRGFLSSSSLSFFLSTFVFCGPEGSPNETWHCIFCCTCWLPVTHAPTFGVLLVKCRTAW